MKVVILTNIPAPYRVPVWNALADAGVDICVLFLSLSEPGRQWKIPTGMRFRWKVLDGIAVSAGRRRIPLSLPLELVRLRPGMILTGGFGASSAVALVYRVLSRGRARLALFGEATDFSERGLSWWKVGWRRWLVKRSDAFLPASSDARDYFVKLGAPPFRIDVSLLTTDVDRFSPSSQRPRQLSQAPARILYCGTLSEEKGIGELLDAYAIVKAAVPGATLLLVGPDALSELLRVQVRTTPGVQWYGFCQYEDLPRFYWEADLFVFPTRGDRFGVVVVEALAAGLPVVCSKYAGCARDLVRDGENGFVVDPRDYRTMAARILDVMKQLSRDKAMSCRARAVVERCRPHVVAAPILSTLRENGIVWQQAPPQGSPE